MTTQTNPRHETTVVGHGTTTSFEVNRSHIAGLAVPSTGARELEVWQVAMERGAASPLHWHDGEEIFVILSGRGEVHAEGRVFEFVGPCTVICPAHVPHQIINAGTRLEGFAIVPLGSKMYAEDGTELKLPWRK